MLVIDVATKYRVGQSWEEEREGHSPPNERVTAMAKNRGDWVGHSRQLGGSETGTQLVSNSRRSTRIDFFPCDEQPIAIIPREQH